MKQEDFVDLANRLDASILDQRDKIDSLKFEITGLLFGAETITDEASMLEFYYSTPNYERNFYRELEALSINDLEVLFKQKKTAAFKGKLAYRLGQKSEFIESRKDYLEKAVKLGEKDAEVYLRALMDSSIIDTKEPAILTNKQRKVSGSSLRPYIERLCNDYWNTRPFPGPEEYKGISLRYYLFVRFAYKLRHTSSPGDYWERAPEANLDYWAPYEEIIDSFLVLYCGIKYLGFHPMNTVHASLIKKMRVPSKVASKLSSMKTGLSRGWDNILQFHDLIDALCKNYWDYLSEQNKKSHFLC